MYNGITSGFEVSPAGTQHSEHHEHGVAHGAWPTTLATLLMQTCLVVTFSEVLHKVSYITALEAETCEACSKVGIHLSKL